MSRDLLLKAAEIYERNGRIDGDYYDTDQAVQYDLDPHECRVCAVGAVDIAAGLTPDAMQGQPGADPTEQAAYDAVGNALRALADHLALDPDQELDRGGLAIKIGGWHDETATRRVLSEMRAAGGAA